MYIRIKKITCLTPDNVLIINISKTATVETLCKQIFTKWKAEPSLQKLFYKGKQLNHENRLMDYDIQLNDVIQLMIQTKKQDIDITDKELVIKKEKQHNDELVDVKSLYYKIGDRIDLNDEDIGGWFECYINSIKAKRSDVVDGKTDEKNILFFAKSEFEREQALYEAGFHEIRPRARYTYDISELRKGENVLVNYNIEEPTERGYWYDFTISKIKKMNIIGTLHIGKNKATIDNCSIKFVKEIMKIESLQLISERTEDLSIEVPIRKSQYFCQKCKDNKSKKCKDCGCLICGGKNDPSTIIICDECNMGFHTSCLNLNKVPEGDEWYCIKCKNDENEIVKAGEKLKLSKRKEKMISSNKEITSRDWGKGMACVGRTKECTIVPKNHYGPVPGVEVGTCWKFRLQVSEAGVHRPHVAGIHGRETDGAYSLVLSGGYEDDVDNGCEFYYTGSGEFKFSVFSRITNF